jgi:hypothetical protein
MRAPNGELIERGRPRAEVDEDLQRLPQALTHRSPTDL